MTTSVALLRGINVGGHKQISMADLRARESASMKRAIRSVLLSLGFALTIVQLLRSQNDYATPVLAGISNHGENKVQPYVTAGDRTYLIGSQDGNFPDMGDHVPGEMGGLWLHTMKLIDGFWASVTDVATNRDVALSGSTEFVNYPFGNRFRYGPLLDSVEIERFQFSPDGQEGLIVQYTFKNAGARKQRLRFDFSVKTDLRPVWFSERLGITDAQDSVAWQESNHLFIAQDIANSWFSVWGAAHAADAEPIANPQPIHTSGRGVTAASRYSLSVDPQSTSTLTFVIAGTATDENAAVNTYKNLAKHHASLLEKKKRHYASIIERARIRIPDHRLQEVYWVKVNTEWLVREVP